MQDSNDAINLQISLSTSFAGMGMLALQHMSSAAFLASLRNMVREFVIRHAQSVNIDQILSTWSYEGVAKWHWDNHQLLVDQMHNTGTYTPWSHQAFLALPQIGTQHKLQQSYSGSSTFIFSRL